MTRWFFNFAPTTSTQKFERTMTASSQLESIIAPAVSALGFEMVCCTLLAQGHRKILRVLVENRQGGITVDDCMRASQQISAVLDVAAPFSGQYHLEVSSPGLDRPLIIPEHYQRFVGKKAHIKLRNALEGRRNFTGELISATQTIVRIQTEEKLFDLELNNIEKANLIPEL
jgi:ribosome maturation factor RimP